MEYRSCQFLVDSYQFNATRMLTFHKLIQESQNGLVFNASGRIMTRPYSVPGSNVGAAHEPPVNRFSDYFPSRQYHIITFE